MDILGVLAEILRKLLERIHIQRVRGNILNYLVRLNCSTYSFMID